MSDSEQSGETMLGPEERQRMIDRLRSTKEPDEAARARVGQFLGHRWAVEQADWKQITGLVAWFHTARKLITADNIGQILECVARKGEDSSDVWKRLHELAPAETPQDRAAFIERFVMTPEFLSAFCEAATAAFQEVKDRV